MIRTNVNKLDFSATEKTAQEDGILFLSFIADSQLYGTPVEYVLEVVRGRSITGLPNMPCYIKGIINLRGDVIPVIDLRMKLGKESVAYTPESCVIILETEATKAGLFVDSVQTVITLAPGAIAMPSFIVNHNQNLLAGVGQTENKSILLLNTKVLLSEVG